MIGMNRHRRDFAAGTRVVSARGRTTGLEGAATFAEMRVETVREIDLDGVERGVNARMTLAHGEETRTAHLGNGSVHEEGPWKVVWTDPLPADDAAAIRIVGDLLGLNAGYHRTLMLWIALREDDVCYVHQLWDHDEAVGTAGIPQPVGPFRMSASPIRMTGLGEVGPGDIVACLHADARLENHLYEHAVRHPRVLSYASDPSAIPDALPWHGHERNRARLGMGDLAGPHLIEEAEDLAWARTQPSRAMVVAWSVEGRGGHCDVRLSVIHSGGIAFHNNDEPGPYLEESIPGPGLWMFEDARIHVWRSHEGETDVEMEGDWRPADMDDVLKAFADRDVAARELLDHLEIDEERPDESTVVEDLMARAAASMAAENALETAS